MELATVKVEVPVVMRLAAIIEQPVQDEAQHARAQTLVTEPLHVTGLPVMDILVAQIIPVMKMQIVTPLPVPPVWAPAQPVVPAQPAEVNRHAEDPEPVREFPHAMEARTPVARAPAMREPVRDI